MSIFGFPVFPLTLVALVAALLYLPVPRLPWHFTWNSTPSMPRGLYRDVGLTQLEVGDTVLVCLPEAGAAFARAQHLALEQTADSPCPLHVQPLIKEVIALPGDSVRVEARGVVVNGALYPQSAPVARLRSGAPLPRARAVRVPAGSVWTWTPHPHSYDSRYWGPMRVLSRLQAVATL